MCITALKTAQKATGSGDVMTAMVWFQQLLVVVMMSLYVLCRDDGELGKTSNILCRLTIVEGERHGRW